MLRLGLVLLIACDSGARQDPAPAAPTRIPAQSPIAKRTPTQPNNVTAIVPSPAIATLTGCWRRDASERWTFRPDGKHGLVVVRELADATYADRARIPQQVTYDPTSETFGFGAAGRIHGLVMLFQIVHNTLETSVYTSYTPGAYAWTGNTWTLKRC